MRCPVTQSRSTVLMISLPHQKVHFSHQRMNCVVVTATLCVKLLALWSAAFKSDCRAGLSVSEANKNREIDAESLNTSNDRIHGSPRRLLNADA